MATDALKLEGRLLFLAEEAETVARQLAGEDLSLSAALPLKPVGADEILPGWAAFFFEGRLGDFPYLGLDCGGSWPVGEGALRRGGFVASVSGHRGRGCLRDAAPMAEYAAGLRAVFASSFDPAYLQACRRVGLLASTDLSLAEALRRGQALPWSAFTEGLDPLEVAFVRNGGLLPFTRARLAGAAPPESPACAPRPMTLAEKILARHAGRAAVQPGDACLVRADWRFSHEQVTASAAACFREAFGATAPVAEPERVLAFADHLAFLVPGAPGPARPEGLLKAAHRLRDAQAAFCAEHGIRCHGLLPDGGVEGICHALVTERYALPGELLVGTDTHASHCGALGCLAWGIGALELAAAWRTGDVKIAVPPTFRLLLKGRLRPGVSARDLVLHLHTHPPLQAGALQGHVLEFQGEALEALGTDARATLTNGAVDLGAFAGLVAPDAETLHFLKERRRTAFELTEALRGDADAVYAATLEVDCAAVQAMAAPPGCPERALPLEALAEPPRIDLAYAGSCTGGKREDLEQVHGVVQWALDHGLRLPLHVSFHLQVGSEDVRHHARDRGWLSAFEEAGITLLGPGCGACIHAGPGASTRPDQVAVGTLGRNPSGRFGPGALWLAGPATVAASAFAGRLCSFEALRRGRR